MAQFSLTPAGTSSTDLCPTGFRRIDAGTCTCHREKQHILTTGEKQHILTTGEKHHCIYYYTNAYLCWRNFMYVLSHACLAVELDKAITFGLQTKYKRRWSTASSADVLHHLGRLYPPAAELSKKCQEIISYVGKSDKGHTSNSQREKGMPSTLLFIHCVYIVMTILAYNVHFYDSYMHYRRYSLL